ncbi:nicotianamine aminotransferase A-like isoform X1 [Iris pallida]|uniref:Nicotianamine aminotransferase A-like isoform X1 n=1 Tax=Iris pallida TaxID=29817 RepID=A0AAX6HBV6_IRIPA|nr:nicotianamine aminotransferase A-like isoform X1 [Iris pallida]
MENVGRVNKLGLGPSGALEAAGNLTVRAVLNMLMDQVDKEDGKPVVPLGHGDPSRFPCFRTTPVAEEAIVEALHSADYNCYCPATGIPSARRFRCLLILTSSCCNCSIAEYLSKDLPYKLSPDDVYVTCGCTQGIETILSVLACPGANIILPKPGFPFYESRAAFSQLEVRHYNLIPERGWEVDLDAVQALADENTAAMVIINPGNPCGTVFTYEHLFKIANTAKKLGIFVIADEVYGHLTFGNTPFVPMGTFGQIVPVLTLGSISKRWMVPGWRLGWMVICDPNGVLKETKIVESIESFLNISADPATFIQGAIPFIIENTKDDFFNKNVDLLRRTSSICYDKIKEIDCITCPHKPDASMFVMVKINLGYLEDIADCIDFSCKLAKEESVITMPGRALGLENWLRITFAIDPASLEIGLDRMKSFCERHAKVM